MEKREYRQRGIAEYRGLSISNAGVLSLKIKMRYDEIATSVSLLTGLNTDITVHAKVGLGKAMNLGIFTIGKVDFDKDGNADILLKSLISSVEMSNICEIIQAGKEEKIQMRFLAVLELQDGGGKQDEEADSKEDS